VRCKDLKLVDIFTLEMSSCERWDLNKFWSELSSLKTLYSSPKVAKECNSGQAFNI
jgi:hypothetical protein